MAQFQRTNYKILGISVQGSESADPQTVIANSGLKVGDEIEIPGDQTVNAITRLWSLNIFSDIDIAIEKKIDDGVFLVIKVSEYPRVEKVLVSGNDELDDDEILEVGDFIRGQILRTQEIYKRITKIKKLYDEEGYLNAKITPQFFTYLRADTSGKQITVTWRNEKDFSWEIETEYDFNPNIPTRIIDRVINRKVLVYEIDEGDEVIVRKISFVGNEAFDDSDLKSTFDETTEAAWWRFWSSSNLKKEDLEKDKSLLKDFYNENGYRDFEILKDTLIYNENKTDVEVQISVFEGPQYKIRNVYWNGNTVYPDSVLSQRLNFSKGDVYNYTKFNQNLRFNENQTDVTAIYQDNGYLGFNLQTREEKVAADSLDIHVNIVEGNRFRVGQVSVEGNTKTKDKVIRRELYTVPGDYFSRNGIFRSIQQLSNLQYFNVEKLYTEGVDYRPANDSTVNLIYRVEEKSSDYLNASVGYSGSFGFSGAIGVTLTNFSIAEPFQLGGGQILNFNWQFGVGNYYRTFSFGFTEPWFLDTPTLVGFDLFDTRQRYIYDLRQSGITLKLGRRLTWPDNFFYVQGRFKFQYNDIIEGRGFYTEGLSRQYSVGATISRSDIDNPIFPSRGTKFSVSGELNGGPLLPGEVDYYKFEFGFEWYKRLFNSNRLTFYASANLGYMDELRAGTPINPFEYYFMGGNGLIIATTPLRGYDDRSVGPKNPNNLDDIIGGRVMTKYTAEIRAAITLDPIPLYFLTFVEAGNVFLDIPNTDFFELKRSVGVGARIMINPIGLIGFDFGYGFDRPSVDGQDPQWQFHFQFGRGF
ncbi:MAG: outer membrane protein assembly factor BamA [Melioribacteraceae bacterium]|nr:MAG: outer membrane protein assembly factor BamA [Melioribacteraceae bacterium]